MTPLTPAQIQAERDFLVRRLGVADGFDSSQEIGMSSTSLLLHALTGAPLSSRPLDRSDLARCERTYQLAPPHLQEKMLEPLEQFRAEVSERESARAQSRTAQIQQELEEGVRQADYSFVKENAQVYLRLRDSLPELIQDCDITDPDDREFVQQLDELAQQYENQVPATVTQVTPYPEFPERGSVDVNVEGLEPFLADFRHLAPVPVPEPALA